ncbi:hypothetical protein Poly24_13730 [Rosistilla carotiformis]|uniref:Uncharacterized protein n=1 Tax=Rosistilla carotiformis TaxID=2528017 RepID=A0A518JQ58_9BACT|nr:hypothetical protein [Rosistilla carotiformis]QDV67672.1 hypothetical protein Poly24_13730 [Rosistilla carotiformis]
MNDNDDSGCVLQCAIAAIGAVVSIGIAALQINAGNAAADKASQNAQFIASKQDALTIELDNVKQWRESPLLVVLRTIRIAEDTANCIIQNNGGRDLVLFGFELQRTVPRVTSNNGGSIPPQRTVIAAERSRSQTIDFSRCDLTSDCSFFMDPAIIVKPGESLTLRCVFPIGQKEYGHIVLVDSNSVTPEFQLFQFEPSR